MNDLTVQTEKLEKSSGEEHLVGIISDASRRKRVFRVETFDIIVTDRRLIFVVMPTAGGYQHLYGEVPHSRILAEDERNFSIERSQVKAVRLTEGRVYVDCCRKRQEENGSLEIDATDKSYTFSLPHLAALRAKQILQGTGLPIKR